MGRTNAAGRNRVEVVRRGRAATFGTYADVIRPGLVTVGDGAAIADPVTAPTWPR